MAAKDIYAWETVSGRVAALLPAAAKLCAAHEKAALDAGILPVTLATWNPEFNALTLYTRRALSKQAHDGYEKAIYDGSLNFAAVTGAEPNWDEEILLKQGSFAVPGVKQLWSLGNSALAGPTPLSNGLVSALLLGGLGYGAGTLAENLFPNRYPKHKKLRKTLGMAGALGGLGVGALNAYANSRALQQPYLKGLVASNATPVDYLGEKVGYTVGYGYNPADPMVPDAIGMNQPTINVPQFNTLMWRDAHKGMINPYGPYGSHTPPPIAAAATGLTSGLAAGIGTSIIRPTDLVQGFVAAGMNPQAANLAGRTLGALASMSPGAQYQLQNMGLWGGVVTAVVPPMFTGRSF